MAMMGCFTYMGSTCCLSGFSLHGESYRLLTRGQSGVLQQSGQVCRRGKGTGGPDYNCKSNHVLLNTCLTMWSPELQDMDCA